jgi:hypothetical protein
MWKWLKAQVELAIGFAILAAICLCWAVTVTLFRSVLKSFPVQTLGVIALVIVTSVTVRRKRDREALERIEEWVTAGTWIPVPVNSDWPWKSLVRNVDHVVVDRAWQSTIDELLVTVGELHWTDNALDGAVVGWADRGAFVVVHLPVPTEPMSLRRPHRTLGSSHRLDRPALHDAFENGEIPPWTAREQSLFTFEAVKGRLHPSSLDSLLLRTLRIVDLLDLGPDAVTDR